MHVIRSNHLLYSGSESIAPECRQFLATFPPLIHLFKGPLITEQDEECLAATLIDELTRRGWEQYIPYIQNLEIPDGAAPYLITEDLVMETVESPWAIASYDTEDDRWGEVLMTRDEYTYFPVEEN